MPLKKIKRGLLLLITFSFLALSAEPTPIIQLDNGKVEGIINHEMNSYLGIPYAQPPVGELRWQPPQPVKNWEGVKVVNAYGNSCPQNSDLGIFAKAGGNEDCLTLNVYTPRTMASNLTESKSTETDKKLPVLVWIHGGSLFVGQGADYDPSRLVLQQAIVVTFNYRLGLLGFFAHPDILKNQSIGINYGLLDQNLALEWVHNNIASFGGDPNNVTIAGESSGGGSVLAHVISPFSTNKFQQAIAMSGAAIINKSPYFGGAKEKSEAETIGMAFAKNANCDQQRDVPACLRQLSVEQILATQSPFLINQSVIDGQFIPMQAGTAFKTGNFNRVIFINGSNYDEGTFFAGILENESGKILTDESYKDTLVAIHGESFAKQVYQEFPPEAYSTPSEAYAASMTSLLFTCPAARINSFVAVYQPIYSYLFEEQTAPSYLDATSFPLKAAHTFELPYLFANFKGNLDNPNAPVLNPAQHVLADEMAKIWVNPRQYIDSHSLWVPYNAQQENSLRFVLPSPVMKQGWGELSKHCDFWLQNGIYD